MLIIFQMYLKMMQMQMPGYNNLYKGLQKKKHLYHVPNSFFILHRVTFTLDYDKCTVHIGQ